METPASAAYGRAAVHIEALACASLHEAAPPAFAAQYGVRAVWFGPVLAQLADQIPSTLYNRVLGLGFAAPATPQLLDDLLALYLAQRIRFAIVIAPEAQPPQLADWLLARGFTPRFRVAKWVRGSVPAPVTSTDLTIAEIGTAQAPDFARVAGEVFGEPAANRPWLGALVGRPGWRHYLALDGAMPVAVAAMFTQDGVAWAGFGGTLASHRGRGAQGALLARRIRDAAAAGCHLLTAESGIDSPEHPNPSYRNMARCGFSLLHLRTHYVYDPDATPTSTTG